LKSFHEYHITTHFIFGNFVTTLTLSDSLWHIILNNNDKTKIFSLESLKCVFLLYVIMSLDIHNILGKVRWNNKIRFHFYILRMNVSSLSTASKCWLIISKCISNNWFSIISNIKMIIVILYYICWPFSINSLLLLLDKVY